MKRNSLIKVIALIACMMCAVSVHAAEAYACYTSADKTLTFYYDNSRSSRSGTTYDLNWGLGQPGWSKDYSSNLTRAVFSPSFANYRPKSTSHWFYNLSNLKTIEGWSNLNTSEVTDMSNMFYFCGIEYLDLSYFNTSKVTRMDGMFYNCKRLTTLDLNRFRTSKVTDMIHMFYNCSNLRIIYVSETWSTSALKSSNAMFTGCTSLKGGSGTVYSANHVDGAYAHIDGGTRNPGYFTDTYAKRPYACYTPSDATLSFFYDDLSSTRTGAIYDLNMGSEVPQWISDGIGAKVATVMINTSFASVRPTSTYRWFWRMYNLAACSMNNLNTSEVTNMGSMFQECSKLSFISVSNFNTSKVTNMNSMFYGCSGLPGIDLSSFNTSKVTDMQYMFYGCTSLKFIYVSRGWSTAAVTRSPNMFTNCKNLVGGKGTTYSATHVDAAYAHIDGGTSNPGYLTDPTAPATPEAYACYTPSNTTLTFYYDTQRSSRSGTKYDLNTGYNDPGWITDGTNVKVTKAVFDSSFAGVRPTTTLRWFNKMENLQSITGMSYLNTSQVTYMNYMFAYCSKLTSLDLHGFNTSKVSDMKHMFYDCSGLTSLDLSSFNTSQVENMYYMFCGCSGLKSIDLSSFNTSKVASMSNMFSACTGLESLDLTSFDTRKVTEMSRMFWMCNKLQTIYVGNGWSTAAVTDSNIMFYDCNNLVGGQGTTFDAGHVDAAYAHVDGGSRSPGYLTDKNAPVPYAWYTPTDKTLQFCYDNQRTSRFGSTYFMNTGYTAPGWRSDGIYEYVRKVVFNSSFSIARPTSTFRWFSDMKNLESISGISYLNTSEVTEMRFMFSGCSKLSSIDVSRFNTAQATNMAYMFSGCSSLTSLDVSNFNTARVTDIRSMFSNTTFTSLNLSSFYTAKVTNISYMFYDCNNLKTIFVGSGWSTAAVTSSGNMFYNCTRLVGGKGTKFDDSHIDAAYAHIDGGTSNPGYLTDKNAPLHGDVNGDGKVNAADVMALANAITGNIPNGYNSEAADVNGDGVVDILDLALLIKLLTEE